MVWVGIWSGIFHWATAFFNLCDYMRTITDFSSNTFALYVGTIYIIKGCEELSINFNDEQYLNGFASAMIAILFTLTIYFLEKIRNTTIGRPFLRQTLADYAYPIATIFWTGFAHFPGNLEHVNFQYLPITRPAFHPTVDRPWVVSFWTLPASWIFAALPFGFLMTLLFYYDHNVSSLTAQARKFPLTKPAGFHWDFFLLGCTCFGAGFLNIPLPNGLVPQAPVHTEALTTYTEEAIETRCVKTSPSSRKPQPYGANDTMATNEDNAPTSMTEETLEITKSTRPTHVAEQRLSHFLMALLLLGLMTPPLLTVLSLMPRAIFSGVFFIVGWGSISPSSNDITSRLLFLASEKRFRSPSHPLIRAHIPDKRVALFVTFQVIGWAATVAISQTLGAVAFPVLIMALIPLRWVLLPRWFTVEELGVLDCLTAEAEVVNVSLGGTPVLPEVRRERARAKETGLEGGRGGGNDENGEKMKRRRVPRDASGALQGTGGFFARQHRDESGNDSEDTRVE
jgi:boron transporter